MRDNRDHKAESTLVSHSGGVSLTRIYTHVNKEDAARSLS